MAPQSAGPWGDGDAYDRFMGRWSRGIAPEFLAWLDAPRGGRWVDVGCGTGALTEEILARCGPAEVLGVDLSDAQLSVARGRLDDRRVTFVRGDADHLPSAGARFDAIVSALVLNFVPDPERTLRGMKGLLSPGGCVAGYVWDYAEGMAMLRRFWDAAARVDPSSESQDEARRFPLGRKPALESVVVRSGFLRPQVTAIEVAISFASFDELWQPFTLRVGPAPEFLAAQSPERQASIREEFRRMTEREAGGPIRMSARAWAFRGYAEG